MATAARQNPRYRGPKEDRCAKHTYSVKVWPFHVTRMPDKRLSKTVFNVEIQEGKRSQGYQKKSYTDTLKAWLNDLNIPT